MLDNLGFFVPRFQEYSEAIRNKMEQNSATLGPNNPNPQALHWPPMDPLTGQGFSVALFVDGSLHAGARPGGGPTREGLQAPRVDDAVQRAFYGRKKFHGLNMQIVSAPDGMSVSSFAPASARRHDALVYALSHFNSALRNAQQGNVMQFKVFGDSAYPILSHTTKNMPPNNPAGTFYAYNSVRESIEWDWRDIKHYWARSSARERGFRFASSQRASQRT